ncbi:endonuclease/exonuclease/phosphatase family protein [Micromonospora sp. NPDC000316]|uniref:endonuclease/exonuclease/phosphatase family protein n=1 Tax=Micromonospora sp. NPDC000316 TaxID=3364216 RepID=UPI00367E3760
MPEQPGADSTRSRWHPRGLGRLRAGVVADPSYRRLRRALTVGCLVVAVAMPAGSSVTGWPATGAPAARSPVAGSPVAGSPVAGSPAARSPTVDAPAPTILRMLQMNLCNSGRAGCYTGRSVTRAAEVIAAERPDLVTLNEICRDDVPALRRALAKAYTGGTVVSAFQAAGDRPSGADTWCRNGQSYGIGLLARLPTPDTPHTVHKGIHPAQDVADPEERAWLCLDVAGALHACTTHLAATSRTVALAQCDHLFDEILPALRGSTGYAPTVLAGDLNLREDGDPDVRACTPPGFLRVDDGALQHVLASGDITLAGTRSVVMDGATDHPALLTTLIVDGRPTSR